MLFRNRITADGCGCWRTSLVCCNDSAKLSYTYYPGTNRLQRIGSAVNNAYDQNGNLIWEPNRTFEQEYRNIASKVLIPQYATDTLTFVYDADLRRVKKSFAYGWNCGTFQKGYQGSTGKDDSADSPTQKGGQSLGTGEEPIPDPNQICWDRTTTQ